MMSPSGTFKNSQMELARAGLAVPLKIFNPLGAGTRLMMASSIIDQFSNVSVESHKNINGIQSCFLQIKTINVNLACAVRF